MAHHTDSQKRLVATLVLTGVIFALQLAGALASGSLSLLSNAGHLFTDVGSLGVALYAAKIQDNQPTAQLSYGFGRSGTVAAFANGLLLAAIGIALIVTSTFRFFHPAQVDVGIMIWVTLVTLLLNLVEVTLVRKPDIEDFNRKSIYWHVLGDSLSSLGILVAALMIRLTGWPGWDPAAALVVGVIILWSSYQVARPSVLALMEAVPEVHKLGDVESTMRQHPSVMDVHHIHLWSLAPGYHALSAHVRIQAGSIQEGQAVIRELTKTLGQAHGIQHVTIQMEADAHPDDEF